MYCLCKLCNYYINENEIKYYEQTKIDNCDLSVNESIVIEDDSNGNYLPNKIIDRGNHLDHFN